MDYARPDWLREAASRHRAILCGSSDACDAHGRISIMQERQRRADLDRAKGLGILLVVFGHIVARQPPVDNEWYVTLKDAVYLFHMPFFMYLSGYVTFLSGAARTMPEDWPKLWLKRARRLLVPFAIFGLAIVAGKLLLAPYLHVDNAPVSASRAMLALLWNTDASPAESVWYIAVLFVLCAATPPLLALLRGNVGLLLAFAVALYLSPAPHVMYLDRVASFYVFFVLGGLAADLGERWLRALDLCAPWFLAMLLAAVTAALAFGDSLNRASMFLLCGLISMPALHGLVRRPRWSRSKFLLTVGSYSFAIYLLNTPCIGLAKALLWKLNTWDGERFLLYAPVLMVAGTLAPILIKTLLLKRVPAFDSITQ